MYSPCSLLVSALDGVNGQRHVPAERQSVLIYMKGKAVPLHDMEALGERGGIAPTHSRPLH
jgi:hypothetical protein